MANFSIEYFMRFSQEMHLYFSKVRLDAKERAFSRARLDVLNFRLCSYFTAHVAIGMLERQLAIRAWHFFMNGGRRPAYKAA